MHQGELNLDDFVDMMGETCEVCKLAAYKECSLYNDWDGTVTCPECWHTTKRERRIIPT